MLSPLPAQPGEEKDAEKQEGKVILMTDEADQDTSVWVDDDKTDYESPHFILQNLKIVHEECFNDAPGHIMSGRNFLEDMISHQICFYLFCALQQFVNVSKPKILLFGDGMLGTRIIFSLIEYGLGPFLLVYARGEIAVQRWRELNISAGDSLINLTGNNQVDIVIISSPLQSFPSILRVLLDFVHPGTVIITSSLGLTRRRIFTCLKTKCIFRTFVEPQNTVAKIKAEKIEKYSQLHLQNFSFTKVFGGEGTVNDEFEDDDGRGSKSINDNDSVSVDTDAQRIEKEKADLKEAQAALEAEEALKASAQKELLTPQEQAADLIARRCSDIRHIIYVLENAFAVNCIPHQQARRMAIKAILGVDETGAVATAAVSTTATATATATVTATASEMSSMSLNQSKRILSDIDRIGSQTASSVNADPKPDPLTQREPQDGFNNENNNENDGEPYLTPPSANVHKTYSLPHLALRLGKPSLRKAVALMLANVGEAFQRQLSKYIRVVDLPLLYVAEKCREESKVPKKSAAERRTQRLTAYRSRGKGVGSTENMSQKTDTLTEEDAPSKISGSGSGTGADVITSTDPYGDNSAARPAGTLPVINALAAGASATIPTAAGAGSQHPSKPGHGHSQQSDRPERPVGRSMHTDAEVMLIFDQDLTVSANNSMVADLPDNVRAMLRQMDAESDDEDDMMAFNSLFDGFLFLDGADTMEENLERKKGVTYYPLKKGVTFKEVGVPEESLGLLKVGSKGLLSVTDKRLEEEEEEKMQFQATGMKPLSRGGSRLGPSSPSRSVSREGSNRAGIRSGSAGLEKLVMTAEARKLNLNGTTQAPSTPSSQGGRGVGVGRTDPKLRLNVEGSTVLTSPRKALLPEM